MIIQRRLLAAVLDALGRESLVLVEGPPRSGKSVFAGQVRKAIGSEALLVEAGNPRDRAYLEDPGAAFEAGGRKPGGQVLIVDGADAATAGAFSARQPAASSPSPPGFPGTGGGREPRVLLVGSPFGAAAPRAPRLSLGTLSLAEVGRAARPLHWLRGGFPEAFEAPSDREALAWLLRYGRRLSEERFASTGLPWAPGRAAALLSMVAESQGRGLNESAVARSLGVSRPTVLRATAALEAAGLLRFLPALPGAGGKRAPRFAAAYIRDSGLFHAFSGFSGAADLLGSARLAASWSGYVVEEALRLLPPGYAAARYETRGGASLELVILREGRPVEGAAIRFARPAAAGGGAGRGAASARAELGLETAWLVLPEAGEREVGGGFREIGLARFLDRMAAL